jgi:HPt (histidine-containing phosphotransfer) domain-containing protein
LILVHRVGSLGSLGSVTEPAHTPNEPSAVLDYALLAELRALSSPRKPRLLADLIDRFEREGVAQLASLRSAASTAATTALDRLAHEFKGWSSTLGAVEVASLCRDLGALCEAGSAVGATELIERLESAHRRAVEALRRYASEPSAAPPKPPTP